MKNLVENGSNKISEIKNMGNEAIFMFFIHMFFALNWRFISNMYDPISTLVIFILATSWLFTESVYKAELSNTVGPRVRQNIFHFWDFFALGESFRAI